jgi:hypothetical protein
LGTIQHILKKSLKIPKGQSESVYRRRTDNTMAKRKCTFLIEIKFLDNDHGYVPLVVNTARSFPHLRLITGFVTRLTRRVSLVEQELLTLPEHLSSSPIRIRISKKNR